MKGCDWLILTLPTTMRFWETATILFKYLDSRQTKSYCILVVVAKQVSTVFWETVKKFWETVSVFLKDTPWNHLNFCIWECLNLFLARRTCHFSGTNPLGSWSGTGQAWYFYEEPLKIEQRGLTCMLDFALLRAACCQTRYLTCAFVFIPRDPAWNTRQWPFFCQVEL